MTEELDPRSKALAAELRAEIAAQKDRWRSVRAFARDLDAVVKTDYTTFTRRLNGETAIPIGVLLPALDLLGVEFDTFVTRAMQRLPHQPE